MWTRRRGSRTENIRNLRFLSISFYCYHFITKRKRLLKGIKAIFFYSVQNAHRKPMKHHQVFRFLSLKNYSILKRGKERGREKEREREWKGVEHRADSHIGAQWPVYPQKKVVAKNTKKYKRVKIVLWWRPDVIFSNAIVLQCYSVYILRKA